MRHAGRPLGRMQLVQFVVVILSVALTGWCGWRAGIQVARGRGGGCAAYTGCRPIRQAQGRPVLPGKGNGLGRRRISCPTRNGERPAGIRFRRIPALYQRMAFAARRR